METIKTSITLEDRQERTIFQFIAYLLQYPDRKWLQWEELVTEAQTFQALPMYKDIMQFLEYIGQMSLDELEKEYVDTFDFNKKSAMYLTYSLAGEERERGQSLLEFKELYAKAGYVMKSTELADYLPVVLEFMAITPIEQAIEMFSMVKPVIQSIYNELEHLKSPYSYLLRSIIQVGENLNR